MLWSVVAESDAKCDSHDYYWESPCQRIIQPQQLLVEENLDHKDVEVYPFHQLPAEGAEEEVVEKNSNGGADSVMARH